MINDTVQEQAEKKFPIYDSFPDAPIAREKYERIKKLEDALGMLVALKTHKDAYGKDKEYEKQQPLAWEQARKLLNIGI